jgi:hypothetical protein
MVEAGPSRGNVRGARRICGRNRTWRGRTPRRDGASIVVGRSQTSANQSICEVDHALAMVLWEHVGYARAFADPGAASTTRTTEICTLGQRSTPIIVPAGRFKLALAATKATEATKGFI